MTKTFLHLLIAPAALVATVATAQTAGSGVISGRVTDASTKLALGGARITVAGTSLETYTSTSGDFYLTNVPAGAQTVQFNYVGYGDVSRPVTVTADSTARLDLALGDETVQLDKFVIEGSLVGTARAINQQRAANTLTSIVAADEIGRFPDQNAAESLQRLPGVSLYRDQGEGRFILVRGINYTLGSVTLNGAKIASPEVGERGIALDVIPADALSSIEVTKVPTPDLDPEGLGGAVNIRTKSAFDNDGLAASFSAQGQYSALADAYSSKFNGLVSQRFADGKLGLLIAPTWQKREFGSHNYEIDDGWTDAVEDGAGNERDLPAYFLQDIAFREYEIERERYGASTALEFKPDAATYLYLRGTYNRFTDTENRHVTVISFVEGPENKLNNLTAISADSATVTGMRRYSRRLRMREKDQDLSAFVLGGEKQLDQWKLDAQLNYSKGKEDKPGETEVRFRRSTRDGSFRYTFSDTYDVNVEQLAGASITDPASYNQFQELTRQVELGEESERGVNLNARYDLQLGQPTYVKAGAVYREKRKLSAVDVDEFGVPSSFTFASVAGNTTDYPYGPRVPQIDPGKVAQAIAGSGFTRSEVFEDSNYDDWRSEEDVIAGYAMAGTTLGRFNLIGGLRAERTKFSTRGNSLDLENETVTPLSAGRSYTNWLPGLHLRYDVTKDLVVRASWSNSIVRPSFGDSAIRRNINEEDEEVTVGNPNLEALESTNWDASVEYYLPSLGLVSVAVFHKDIENFSYETEIDADPTYPGFDITSFRNGSEGKITGVELAWQQQLRFLPAPFDGFGVQTNVTFADSEADYPTRPGEQVRFIGQSDYVGNAALTYEKSGFFVRLALNFRSERLREDEPIGGDATEDRWVDDFAQLDLTTSYRINGQWELFAEFLNLTNEPFRVLQKGGDLPRGARLVQFEEYDWTANFGVRWKL